jgi:peptide/nickel transport system permease protein
VEPLIEDAARDRTGSPTGAMAPTPATAGKKVKTRGKSPTAIAFARLRRDKVAMVCASIFGFFVLIAIFAPLLARLEGQDTTTLHQDLLDQYGYPIIGSRR